jgi:Tfp pilus assembly protein PilN
LRSLASNAIKLRVRNVNKQARDIIKFGISAMVVLILICSVLLSRIYFKALFLKSLDKEYQSVNEEAQKLETSFNRMRMVRKYLTERGFPLEVLKELYRITPTYIRYNEIVFNANGDITLSGSAESMSQIYTFVSELERSKFFKDVKTKYTNTQQEANKIIADFKIACSKEESEF